MISRLYKNSPHFFRVLFVTILYVIPIENSAFGEVWLADLSIGKLSQNYTEIDNVGLTHNGVLNTETGDIQLIKLSVLNKQEFSPFDTNVWKPYGKLSLSYANGSTDYDGYLQSGSTLIPHSTSSENTFVDATQDLGLSHQINDLLILTPYISINHNRWKRELEQYSEKFRHTSLLGGITVAIKPSRELPLILQVHAKAGKLIDSKIDVPKLGLSQSLGHSNIYEYGMAGKYQINNQLSVNAELSQKKYKYEETDIDNGYQYPDSKSKQTLVVVGLGYQF